MMVLAILTVMFWVQPKIATLALVSVGLLYLSISQICKKKIRKNSEILAKKSVSVHKMLQEGLGGIREIIIEGNQQYFLRLFSQEFKTYYDACAEVQIVSLGPRYIVEMFGIIFIAFFSVKLVTDGAEGANFIPVLGALALCAQRLLPLIQQIYSSIVAIGAHRESVVDAIGLLEQKINIREPFGVDLKVIKNIIFKNVSFKYDCEEEWTLKAINIEIKAGDKLGIVGLTGSGKSTLIDLLMGLLNPTSGFIEINNNKMNILNANQFQSRISHVPQSIYLKDATILENIAFSENQSKIDVDRAMKCIEAAQLHEMIKSIPLGLNTTVGERGIKFSGGELQRIGIARALYKNSSVIVLDEATSALDEETEGLIINLIKEIFVGGIIIMISHRPKSLTMCNKIIQIKEHSAIMIKNE
jgi:ATP-binding cassette subfamily B protein